VFSYTCGFETWLRAWCKLRDGLYELLLINPSYQTFFFNNGLVFKSNGNKYCIVKPTFCLSGAHIPEIIDNADFGDMVRDRENLSSVLDSASR
jgi:hypothetical protein